MTQALAGPPLPSADRGRRAEPSEAAGSVRRSASCQLSVRRAAAVNFNLLFTHARALHRFTATECAALYILCDISNNYIQITYFSVNAS